VRPRHGQGPIPNGRPVPPKTARASTFQPGREPTSSTPTPAGTAQRPSPWDRYQESQAGIPGARTNTTRASPSRPKFASGTPGGDEPQAQGLAYFKVSRDEHSARSRSQTRMPPPPSPAPTAKKPNPLQQFRDQISLNEPFGKKKSRQGTHNQKGKRDGTNLGSAHSTGLHRSATSAFPRDSNNRTGYYATDRASMRSSHKPAATVSSNHHSASPPGTRGAKLPRMYSSSSSTASSSGDERPPSSAKVNVPPNNRQPHAPNSERSRRGFNLYANAGDERMAPQANVGGGGYNGIRRHSAVDLNTDKPPEGFQEHLMKHDAGVSSQQSTNNQTKAESTASKDSQPPLSRSQSWQEKYRQDHRDKWGSPPRDEEIRSAGGEQAAKTPMYESRGYNPFSSPPSCGTISSGTPKSDKWSDQWPFMSPKKPRAATAEPPPYWAIPSSLPPPTETESRKRAKTHTPSRLDMQNTLFADTDPFSSFSIPHYTNKTPTGAPPLRSHSSDHIDTNFSPDGWHGRSFETPASRTATPLRTVSPTENGRTRQQQRADAERASSNGETIGEDSSTTPKPTAPPPPPLGQEKYSEKQWAPHLNDIKFDTPQVSQPGSPIKQSNRKRTRARAPKLSTAQPTVNDADDEPTASSALSESFESSKFNSDVDPMDIDEPTPPKNANDKPVNGAPISSAQPNGTTHHPSRVPTLPPRKGWQGQATSDAPHLNLGDLNSVYPIAPSNEGLANMNDIAMNLPFESRASETKPVTDEPLHRVELPKPPVCARPPSSLTVTSCARFCGQVHSYMEEWTKFTAKMVNLLSTRQVFNQGNAEFQLMDMEDIGYDNYMKGLEESRRTRAHFEVACENHYKTMQEFGLVRQEMRRGRGGVPG